MIRVQDCGIALVDLKQYYFRKYRVIERGKRAGYLEIERMTRRKDALKRGQQILIVPPEGILRWPKEDHDSRKNLGTEEVKDQDVACQIQQGI